MKNIDLKLFDERILGYIHNEKGPVVLSYLQKPTLKISISSLFCDENDDLHNLLSDLLDIKIKREQRLSYVYHNRKIDPSGSNYQGVKLYYDVFLFTQDMIHSYSASSSYPMLGKTDITLEYILRDVFNAKPKKRITFVPEYMCVKINTCISDDNEKELSSNYYIMQFSKKEMYDMSIKYMNQ